MQPYDIDADIDWFKKNLNELSRQHNGKTLAVRNGEVLAVGNSLTEVAEKVELPVGQYLIRVCSLEKNAYSIHIHTPGLVAI